MRALFCEIASKLIGYTRPHLFIPCNYGINLEFPVHCFDSLANELLRLLQTRATYDAKTSIYIKGKRRKEKKNKILTILGTILTKM